jgi:hypothetical protein
VKSAERVNLIVVVSLVVAFIALILVFAVVSARGNRQNADPPADEYTYYVPYVAKSLWGLEDREWFTIDAWSENGDYYATLEDREGGFLILGKSLQSPDNVWWVNCGAGGSNYWWGGYYFWWINGSGHPPYCLPFAAQEILVWPTSTPTRP